MTEQDDKQEGKVVKTRKKVAGARKKAAVTGPVGVIDSIIAILKKSGGTIEQIGAKLAKKFPDRDADGMVATVRTQMFRLRKEKGLKIKAAKQKGTRAWLYRL